MTQSQILSDNASSKRIFANLSLAIDETRLIRQIADIEHDLKRIEYMPEQSDKASYLRGEKARLELQLAATRLRAR